MAAVISVKNLHQVYRLHRKQPGLKGSLTALWKRTSQSIVAVNNISFSIQAGEMVGFIGPNGAGKTTTLKILSGLLYPTSGQVRVLGFNPWERQYDFLRQISLVMGQKNQLWWNLPAIETFKLFQDIYSLSDKVYRQSLDFLVNTLEFQDLLTTPVRQLSLGQRMKAELIAALLHQPKVLFLDEPTIGLDVVMQKKIRQFLTHYNQTFKASVLLTSHYMDDVRQLAKRVILINQGNIVYDGSLRTIIQRYATHKEIEIIFSKSVPASSLTPFGHLKIHQQTRAVLQVKRQQAPHVSAAILQKLPVIDINIRELALADIISLIFQAK